MRAMTMHFSLWRPMRACGLTLLTLMAMAPSLTHAQTLCRDAEAEPLPGFAAQVEAAIERGLD